MGDPLDKVLNCTNAAAITPPLPHTIISLNSLATVTMVKESKLQLGECRLSWGRVEEVRYLVPKKLAEDV